MSTQPVSQEFGTVNPRILKDRSVVDRKDKKKRKTAKRVSDWSKRAQAKPKAGRRRSRTEEIVLTDTEVRKIEETIEPKETVPAQALACDENVPLTNEDLAANPASPVPFAEPCPGENDSDHIGGIPAEDFSLAGSNSATEVHVENEPATPMTNAAVEAAELNEQVPLAPVVDITAPSTFYKPALSALCRLWNCVQKKFRSQQARKRLRVCETVSLGEKRFLAVIQVDGQEFLVGGSSTSVSTLAQLEPNRDFSDALRQSCEQGLSHA